MNNKLYCTFTTSNDVDVLIKKIQKSYIILFDKIFVLENLDGTKTMLTYNVDMNNTSEESIIESNDVLFVSTL